MVDKKYKDFDAAITEADKKPIKFKMAGSDMNFLHNYQLE